MRRGEPFPGTRFLMTVLLVGVLGCAFTLAVADVGSKAGEPRNCSIPVTITVAPGAEFDVPVSLDDAAGVLGFQFTLTYDAAVLQYTGITAGDLLAAWGAPMVNPQPGLLAGVGAGATELSGGGTFFTVQLQALASADGQSSILHFSKLTLNDGEIPVLATDGQVEVHSLKGSLNVNIEPEGARNAGAQWRVDSGEWQSSGATVSALPVGPHDVSFKEIPDWVAPGTESVTIAVDQTTSISRTYARATGSLQVVIGPDAALAADAQWQRTGASTWRGSGDTESGIPTGDYVVEFKDLSNWTKPVNVPVTISRDQTVVVNRTYTPWTGSATVTILPQAAVDAGAEWRLDGGAWRSNGDVVTGLAVGGYMVEFAAIAGWDSPSDESFDIVKDQLTSIARSYVRQTGSLQVTILPPEAVAAGARWRRVGAPTWLNSGETESAIPTGDYTVEFRDVAQWTRPSDAPVTISVGPPATLERTYTLGSGSLQVTITPQGAIDAGAQWRRTGTAAWYGSEYTEPNVPVGECTVEFRSVSGWNAPASQTASITADQVKVLTASYECQTLDVPGDVQATEGALSDRVSVTWSESPGATSYAVYRGESTDFATATLLETVSASPFDDFSAEPPTVVPDNEGGCSGGGTDVTTYHYYQYWVVASSVCGESEPAGPCRGYCGSPVKSMAIVFEDILPFPLPGETVVRVRPDSKLAVRVRSLLGIDAGSVQGLVWSSGYTSDAIQWASVDGDAGRDGWAFYVPSAPWTPGDSVQVEVRASTLTGVALGPFSHTFDVAAEEERSNVENAEAPSLSRETASVSVGSQRVVEVSLCEDSSQIPTLPGGVGPVYVIGPNELFDFPQLAWLPVPPDVDPHSVELHYYHTSDPGRGWYRAENVSGWLVRDSAMYQPEDAGDTTYLGFWVRHSGIVQLAVDDPDPNAQPGQAGVLSVNGGWRGIWADVAVVLTTLGALGISGRWSAHKATKTLRL